MAKVPSKKSASTTRKTTRRHNGYQTYIFKILKKTDSVIQMQRATMSTLNKLTENLIKRVATECVNLLKSNGKKTLDNKTVAAAFKLVLGEGELSKHAEAEGQKAAIAYQALPWQNRAGKMYR